MNNKLSYWINDELGKKGWSQRELARRAKVSHATISRVIAGQVEPTFDFCAAIAAQFGEMPEYVFRKAGLLPELPGGDNSPLVSRLTEVVKRLPLEDQADILEYAEFRYQKIAPDEATRKARLKEAVMAALAQLLPEEREEWLTYLSSLPGEEASQNGSSAP